MLSEKDICCDCRGKTFDFSQIWAPFAYEGIATILVQLYKFQERFELAEFWAERLAEGVTQPWPLVPVPAQAQNRRLRGWDPVTLLCRKLSQLKQVPVKPLLRRGTTLIQKNLSREDRLLNLSGKISFHPGGQGPPQAVYLVDDVMTTGATLHECAKILRQNGVQEVRAVCCTCR